MHAARLAKQWAELLKKVATIYEAANRDHEPPTQAVQKALLISYSTATKYV
ncbi:MAG TPA: hypothetical protein VMZ73_06325 [Acidimicrobiales bacterium]|nr:hypothetical protein [Acidimicrobiales bacterium]